MAVKKRPFGVTKGGKAVELYTISNAAGASIEILTYGGTVRALCVPDRTGRLGDVVLGYDTLAEYEAQGGYLGALIGRVGNRLEGGEFTLNEKTYRLFCNDGRNHLHGGKEGFNAKIWTACRAGENGIELTYTSPDGEEGYPGTLRVKVIYTFTEDNLLHISYSAVSDADTLVNLTNHAYFNLAEQGSGDVLGHKLQLGSAEFCENSAECLPTGKLLPVEGTPFDFRTPHAIGERIGAKDVQLQNCGGYDHNFVLATGRSGAKEAARVSEPSTGRTMTVYTTAPGVQLYTGNFLDETYPAKGGGHYRKHAGFCLETQFFPNAMKCENFPSIVLRAGVEYAQHTQYAFGTDA